MKIQNVYLCLKCMEIYFSKYELDNHYNNDKNHRLYMNYKNWKIICLDCSSQFDISLVDQYFCNFSLALAT